ncbi:MAG TPA: outer membrane beta-barrel protein [Bacteroidia bacterium]|nr:outer membrane beta-barrel protein [Bacteroidia bacterium]
MKTKLFSIASLLIILSVFSSTRADAQIKFGPIVGANFSNITGDDVFDSDGMLIGFHIGALVNFGVTDYLMIEPQILYSTKGAKGKSTDLNFEYIEIPIWIKWKVE